jgi:hypothetical protein
MVRTRGGVFLASSIRPGINQVHGAIFNFNRSSKCAANPNYGAFACCCLRPGVRLVPFRVPYTGKLRITGASSPASWWIAEIAASLLLIVTARRRKLGTGH